MKKDLICQIREKEALKKEEKVRVYYDDLKIIEASNDKNKIERELQTRQHELKLAYKKAITEQIQENSTEKRRVSSLKHRPFVFFDATGSGEKIVKTNFSQKEIEEFKKLNNELKELERKESENTNK